MPPHSLGPVDWNTTKPASSLAFLLLFVTPRAALQSQLYSFLRLLLRALAEGTYAKGCFWFRRVPQLSHRKRSGNLNRRIHPRSGNLLFFYWANGFGSNRLQISPSCLAWGLAGSDAPSRSIISLTAHHNPSGWSRKHFPRARPFSSSQRNSGTCCHLFSCWTLIPRVLKSDPNAHSPLLEGADNTRREGNKSLLTP